MKQKFLRMSLVFSLAGLPALIYGQQQLGGTTADRKMLEGGSGSAMGGLYSPSLYDGTANINIPIYQYSAEGGEYGISLGYNTRGIKVDELSGPVGLGFKILSGGSIQRVVKDIPDDIYAENYNDITVDNNVVLVNPEKRLRGRLVVYGQSPAQVAEDSVYRDRESDDYIVSIGNLNFTFNLGSGGFVFTIPERKVKIELLRNGTPVTSLPSQENMGTLSFRITDEQGNRYLFSGGDYITEDVQDKYGHGQNIGWYTYYKSWVISKVITASGAEINYSYATVGHASPYQQYSAIEPGSNGPGGAPHSDLTQYKRLDSIHYPNGITAWFKFDTTSSKDDNTGALREVQLQSGGVTQLRYLMDQSYFVASGLSNTDPDTGQSEVPYTSSSSDPYKKIYRLKLNGIRVAGQSGPVETLYTFAYDPLQLPKRFNGSQDYFGYYNGKTPTPPTGSSPMPELSIPDHQPFTPGYTAPYYGVNRSPDPNYLKACILTTIKNTYGGQVQFLYDEHVLTNVLNSTNMPGLPYDSYFIGVYAYDGLRLQAIIEKDTFHTGNYRKTTFSYSGGQLLINGGYFHSPYQLDDISHVPKKILMTSQYLSRHQFVSGANHGYSTVTVRSADQDNNQLARTVYNFTNFKDESNQPRYQRVGSGSLYFYEFPYAEKQLLRDWEMGLPLSVSEYDQNDRITLETGNSYAFSIDSTTSAGKIENSRVATVRTDYIPSGYHELPHTVDYVDSYRPFRGKSRLTGSQIRKYTDDTHYISDAVSYSYDSLNNLVHTLTSNSKGEYFKTEHIYNYNLGTLLGSGLQAYTDAGLEKVVSTQRWKTDSSGTSYSRLMDGFINTFEYSSQQLRPKTMYTLIPGDAVSHNQYTGYSGSGAIPNAHGRILQAFGGTTPGYFRKASEVLLSDAKGNPLESRLGDQDQFKAMIWDDLNGKKLAEAGNCHYSDIAYCGFETPGTGTVTRGNMTYNASAVSATPPSGSLYGAALAISPASSAPGIDGSQALVAGREYILSFWSLGVAPQVLIGSTPLTLPAPLQDYYNYKYYSIRFTAAAADHFHIVALSGTTYIDDVQLHPASAQMQHWSYTPLFGAGSSADANGRLTFIQYDGQGRPKLVRDKDGNIISKTEYGIQ